MKEIIIEYIQQHLLSGKTDISISPDDDLLGSGLVDSMGMMQLIAFIENKFEFKVPFEDMVIENFMTPNAIAEYVGQKKAA